MKRMIYSLLFGLCSFMGMAQTVELMSVYTDKDCYLAGEELWVKVCIDDDALPGNGVSKVAYIEICDTAQVRVQGKIALDQGTGWARIQLPQTMHSGVYQLTAYTQYMRNLNLESFPRKHLAVLNVLGTSSEDRLFVNDTTAFPIAEPLVVGDGGMKSDKKVYGFREKVSLSWQPHLADAKDLTLSVVRKDYEAKLAQPEIAAPVSNNGERWIAECEGHIVTARVEGENLPEAMLARLSCVGKEVKVFEGKKKSNDLYSFYTYGVNGQQDIVLSVLDNEQKAYRMKIVSPFAESLPKQLPDLYCHYNDSDLISRSVALQLTQAMPKAVLPKGIEEKIYGELPDKTYNLDEYVRFNIFKECIVEFIMGLTIGSENGQLVIKMLQKNNKDYNLFPVLVLIDGVVFYNHEEALGYNAHGIHYVHQYRGNFVLGETIYGGILSIVTHRGNMPDMRINKDMQMFSYEFPQEHPVFEMPDYAVEEVRLSRRPDFRHTLYWNPNVKGKTGVEFYTSDMEGTYVSTMEGVASDGKKIKMKWEFEVK